MLFSFLKTNISFIDTPKPKDLAVRLNQAGPNYYAVACEFGHTVALLKSDFDVDLTEPNLLNNSSSLSATLGVTKFTP